MNVIQSELAAFDYCKPTWKGLTGAVASVHCMNCELAREELPVCLARRSPSPQRLHTICLRASITHSECVRVLLLR